MVEVSGCPSGSFRNCHKVVTDTYRLQKNKPIDEYFEDEVWCLFADMGFNVMNRDRKLKLNVIKGETTKQIDVLAKDDETILIIECKVSNEPTKRNLQKDLGETNAIREDIRKGLYELFGRTCKMAWVYATKNIIWSDPDLKRAEHYSISIIKDEDIEYFSELLKHIGRSAKYQLLADIFQHKKIPGLECKVPAIRGEMGKTHFYAFAIEPYKLLKISYVCHRLKGSDKNNLITYQRMLDKNRLKEIRNYVENGGLFPNSIVINLESSKITFNALTTKSNVDKERTEAVLGILELPSAYKSAFIIDGQHRLYGFTDSNYAIKTTIPVIAFENLNEIDQADLFIDINSKQKRVKRSLLEDLVADTKWGSEKPKEQLQALRSKVVTTLGRELDSPLYEKISASEMKNDTKRPLTIVTLTSALNKTQLFGHIKTGKNIIEYGPLFDNDMETSLIRGKVILSGYLNLFKNAMKEHWDLGSAPGGYLCTNGGVTALIYVMKAIIDHIDRKAIENSILKSRDMKPDELLVEISKYTQPLIEFFKTAPPEVIQDYRKKYGFAGYTDCSNSMMEQINKKYPDFINANLKTYLEEIKSESHQKAKLLVPEVHLMISEKVLSKLKKEFGTENDDWWYKGIPKTVRLKVSERKEDDEQHPALEKCFDLIHYKEVILDNWSLFEKQFSRGNGNKKEKMSWMNELNEIRKKVSHPERGRVSTKELAFVEEIHHWLKDMSDDIPIQLITLKNEGKILK